MDILVVTSWGLGQFLNEAAEGAKVEEKSMHLGTTVLRTGLSLAAITAVAIASLALTAISGAAPVFAQSSGNFSISPPPIADTSFEDGKGNLRLSIPFMSLHMDNGFNMAGAGFNLVGRKAFSDMFALNFAIGAMAIGGSQEVTWYSGSTKLYTDKTEMTSVMVPMSANIELQIYKGDVFNTILFGGPLLNMGSTSVTVTRTAYAAPYTNSSTTSSSSMSLGGYQAGFQLGWKLGDFDVSGFGMQTSQSGTVTTDVGSFDIPRFTSTSYGADIKYVPLDMALSSMIQNSGGSAPGQGYQMVYVVLSWIKDF